MKGHQPKPPSAKPSGYEVGWGRPPKHTQWKKGESGRRGHYRRINIAEMIERQFAEVITVQRGSGSVKMPVFEAIVEQLTRKAASGEKRAMKVLMEYFLFVKDQPNKTPVVIELLPDPRVPPSKKKKAKKND